MRALKVGQGVVTCTAHASAGSQPSNFLNATSVSFNVAVAAENAAPVAFVELEGVVGFATAASGSAESVDGADIFALLSGARSFDPDGSLVSASWSLLGVAEGGVGVGLGLRVGVGSLSRAPLVDSPHALTTFVSHLLPDLDYTFQLKLSDDLGETDTATITVRVPDKDRERTNQQQQQVRQESA